MFPMQSSYICLFRAEDKSYTDSFNSIGMSAFFVEPLSFRFVNGNLIWPYVRDPTLISGVIATSKNALKALEIILGKQPVLNEKIIKNHKIFAVGPGTARKAEQMGFLSVLIPEKKDLGGSNDLAKFVVDYSRTVFNSFSFNNSSSTRENLPFLLLSSNMFSYI